MEGNARERACKQPGREGGRARSEARRQTGQAARTSEDGRVTLLKAPSSGSSLTGGVLGSSMSDAYNKSKRGVGGLECLWRTPRHACMYAHVRTHAMEQVCAQ